MIVSSIIFCFLAYKLYLEFGWHIYKKIGADLAMRGRYPIMLYYYDNYSSSLLCRSIQNVSNLYDVTQVGLFLSAGPLGSIPCIAHCRMVARSNVRWSQIKHCQGVDRAYHSKLCGIRCYVMHGLLGGKQGKDRQVMGRFYLSRFHSSCDAKRNPSCTCFMHSRPPAWDISFICSSKSTRIPNVSLALECFWPSFVSWMIPICIRAACLSFLFLVCVDIVLIVVSVPVSILCLRNFNHGLINHSKSTAWSPLFSANNHSFFVQSFTCNGYGNGRLIAFNDTYWTRKSKQSTMVHWIVYLYLSFLLFILSISKPLPLFLHQSRLQSTCIHQQYKCNIYFDTEVTTTLFIPGVRNREVGWLVGWGEGNDAGKRVIARASKKQVMHNYNISWPLTNFKSTAVGNMMQSSNLLPFLFLSFSLSLFFYSFPICKNNPWIIPKNLLVLLTSWLFAKTNLSTQNHSYRTLSSII